MSERPVILFGAFDRHNFGDLLLAQVAARQLSGRTLLFAGLAQRDLRADGGFASDLLAARAATWPAADLVHVGGEILGCSAYEAAVMLLDTEQFPSMIGQVDREPLVRRSWASAFLGSERELPYLLGKRDFPAAVNIVCQAIGGVDFTSLPEAAKFEAISALHSADVVSVRDEVTQKNLAAVGVGSILVPDPAVLVAHLFSDEVARQVEQGEVANLRRLYPQGFLAVQCSADFGDDDTLNALARQLDALASETGRGIVLFRAGLAPWHDELAVYRRLRGVMSASAVSLFSSSHLWDICALLSVADAFVGSSLHGRIVAEAFGKPALNLLGSPSGSGKLQAYDKTWSPPSSSRVVAMADVAENLICRLAELPGRRTEWQAELVDRATRAGLDRLSLSHR